MIDHLNRLGKERPLCISIVGAGGKTTLMSMLAKQLPGKASALQAPNWRFMKPTYFKTY